MSGGASSTSSSSLLEKSQWPRSQPLSNPTVITSHRRSRLIATIEGVAPPLLSSSSLSPSPPLRASRKTFNQAIVHALVRDNLWTRRRPQTFQDRGGSRNNREGGKKRERERERRGVAKVVHVSGSRR